MNEEDRLSKLILGLFTVGLCIAIYKAYSTVRFKTQIIHYKKMFVATV
jgi:hypothetical protein